MGPLMFLVKCICLAATHFSIYCFLLFDLFQKMLLIMQKYMFIRLQMLPSNSSYLLRMSGYTRWRQ